MLRWIKIALVALVGLHALFYAAHNIANFDMMQYSLHYVMTGTDHAAYPETAFFKTGNGILIFIATAAILIGEFLIAYFGLKGAWDLFKVRKGDVAAFHLAKRNAVIAGAMALLVWFGLFMTFGAAFFQMWQTQLGGGSLQGSFYYAAMSALVILFVVKTED